MNIDIVRIHFKDNYGDDEYSYKYLPFQYCCEYLKNCPVISFGTECNTIVDDDGYLTETDVELPHFSVSWDEPIPYEDDTWSYYSKITHCPFCGASINVNVVKEEDMASQYATMNKLRDSKNEIRRNTDSLKERDKLNKEISELDEKINEFMSFGEYHYDTLKYKGYEGSIEYSTEDKVYHGKILNVKDLVDYNSETEDDIENQFHLAVDDYIDFKKEIGRDD